MNMNANQEHWPAMARAWDQSGAPLRPSPQDVAAYSRRANEWMDTRRAAPRVLLLGVTPEIYNLPWPEGRDLLAVDRTPAMIAHVWVGKPGEVLQASWLDLPLPSASRDIALCDGGLHLLDHPAGQKKLVERLHDVLAPGGRCIFRLFTPPAEKEPARSVLDDLLAGRVANLNILKLRLGMALQGSVEGGVAVKEVWNTLRALAPDWGTLALRLDWPVAHLAAIDVYRESDARYHFMSVAQVTELFCGEGRFASLGFDVPDYDLGERCPIIVFERR
jgi:SAM-dependent methyltransferase